MDPVFWNEDIERQLEAFDRGDLTDGYRLFGAHPARLDGEDGWMFTVWAPAAAAVSVIGDFNYWNPEDLFLSPVGHGVWRGFSRFAAEGQRYKYCVTSRWGNRVEKADPYGVTSTPLPDNSSVLHRPADDLWTDGPYREEREKRDPLTSPMNIYEVHAGSWKRHPDGSYYGYRDLERELIPYVKEMGYTHIEFLPLTEYPYDPSWGYQVTGYYAPTARYGSPEDLKRLVNAAHEAGIGVILDWVPAHFPKDSVGLYEFDGQPLYEPSDPLMNEQPDWGTRKFDYGRGGVVSFLVSSALYWLREYHFDGIRVDAVASMLYLDYGRSEYRPNKFGGKENLEAIEFLRKLNTAAFSACPRALMVAEESTAFPLVSAPVYNGGLGFLFKWNMGWMNDLLRYMSADPIYRQYEHDKLTFQLTYAFSEHFILPLSHDEVVHGKYSLIGRMPGDYESKFFNLRAFYAYMMTEPGKKLTFMGSELAQFIEWDYRKGLDWLLLDYDRHRQMQAFVRDLNHFYLDNSELWENDLDWEGFQWINPNDRGGNVISYRRINRRGDELVVFCNFCPVKRENYLAGLPEAGTYDPVFSSDEAKYGGCGTKLSPVRATEEPMDGLSCRGSFTLPPLSVTIYRRRKRNGTGSRRSTGNN